jgi:hypothetical protein
MPEDAAQSPPDFPPGDSSPKEVSKAMSKRSERPRDLQSPRQWNARSCTLWWIIVSSPALVLTAFLSGNTTLYKALGKGWEVLWNPGGARSEFTLTQWLVFITPALALLTAWLAHHYDVSPEHEGAKNTLFKVGGGGIKDAILRIEKGKRYNLKTDVIAASMTKQSILAAISAGLIVFIQPSGGQLQAADESLFKYCARGLATGGFAFAILLLLISMVCYDYASRFNWPNEYKSQLVRKALLLDVLSWYFLLTSFTLSIALISPRLSVLTCALSGFLMWWYYFLREPRGGPEGPTPRTADAHGAGDEGGKVIPASADTAPHT